VPRFRRSLRTTLVASAGVATALGLASLTQAAGDDDSKTATSKTATTKTTPTTTTPAPAPAPAPAPKPKPKPKAVKRTITCKAAVYATRAPATSAEEFGTLSCAAPLGKGVQHNRASVTRNADSTKGTFSGAIKLYLNTGTVRGTYKSQFTVQNATVSYDGTIKISSGTGEFKGVTGTGTLTGSSTNAIKSSFTEKLALTFPPGPT
jgi:hypothetical protein